MPVGDEHRVVAEAAVAARRPHRLAMHLPLHRFGVAVRPGEAEGAGEPGPPVAGAGSQQRRPDLFHCGSEILGRPGPARRVDARLASERSEEHTSELQSLMRISYAVFCLKKKKNRKITYYNTTTH